MITDIVIEAIETELDKIVNAHIVPEDEAYPTSGSTFIRVTGDDTEIEVREASLAFTVHFSVICSIRTRDFVKQNKYKPYKTLINIQETCFFHLIVNQAVNAALLQIAQGVSLSGRMESSRLNTRVQVLSPEFYGSAQRPHVDVSSDREAGYLLSQLYSSPNIIVPYKCFQLPEELTPTPPDP